MYQHLLLWKVKKLKQSRYRPGVAQRVPGGLGSQISWHSAHGGGEVVSLTHRPPLPPGMFLVLIFTRGWVDIRAIERSKGNMSLKNSVTPPGIVPGTVRLVAQRLNHYTTPGHLLLFQQLNVKHFFSPSYSSLCPCGIHFVQLKQLWIGPLWLSSDWNCCSETCVEV